MFRTTVNFEALNRHFIHFMAAVCLIVMASGCKSLAYRPASHSLKVTKSPNRPASHSLKVIKSLTNAGESWSNGTAPTIVNDSPDRQMVYSAWLTLVVQRVDEALETLKIQTKEVGGYINLLEKNTITLKIPAKQLDSFLQQAEALGVVSNRRLYAEDVTETVRDTEIRLKNAIEMHKRLLALMDKGGKVEDLLKIEKEIQRVTEVIEGIKGKKELLANQISFAAVQITLNASIPQDVLDEEIPFDWVKDLGNDMLTGKIKDSWTRTGGKQIPFQLPKDFVAYHEAGYVTRATSADGVLLKVQKHANFKGGSLSFWSKLIRKSLLKKSAITLNPDEKLVIKGKKPAIWIQGSREVKGKTLDYILVLAMNDKHVYTFEAWGESKAVATNTEALKTSAKTVQTGSWFFGL